MERPTPENPQRVSSRLKVGLETPLQPRLWRESRLIIAPPRWYDNLTYACLLFGALGFIDAILQIDFIPNLLPAPVLIWAAPLVFVAGLWAQLSNERMTLDQRSQTYSRREGQGVFKRITRGKFEDIDALVLLAEQEPIKVFDSNPVTYRLVLYWKAHREPLMIIRQETVGVPPGAAINAGNIKLLSQGQFYARFIGVPFYDNSYFHSPEPLKAI